MLPRIVPSTERVRRNAALDGVPIAGILGDQQAALVGQTCFTPGEAKNTYGTGCFLLMNTGATPVPSTSGLLTTVAYQLGEQTPCYALEGSIAITGALVQWLRDNLGLIRTSAEIETLARIGRRQRRRLLRAGVLRPLRAVLERRRARRDRRPHALRHRGHIARAALEATAFQTRDVLEAMEQDSGIADQQLRVDGGMVVNELLMQFQADILDVPVVRPQSTETTALGAAYAAGLAVGYWREHRRPARNWGVSTHGSRRWRRSARELIASWRKAVTRSFDWA